MGTVANVLHGISSLSIDGADVGFTSGGVEIEKSVDTFEKLVDQVLDALDIVPTQYMFHVNTEFAEATLTNLYFVWNETTAPVVVPAVTRTLDLGYQQEIPEHALVFVGTDPEGNARTYTVYRAKSADASAHSLKKDEQIIIPVAFRCLPDFTKAEGAWYGKIVDTL